MIAPRSIPVKDSEAARPSFPVRQVLVVVHSRGMNRVRRLPAASLVGLSIVAFGWSAGAQAPARGTTSFRDVSIRKSADPKGLPTVRVQPDGRVTFTTFSINMLVLRAYGVGAFRVAGFEPWMGVERYDIVGHVTGRPPDDVLFAMTRNLLEQRFGLRVHFERQERQVTVLVKARADGKLGPNIRPAAASCSSARTESRQFEVIPPTLPALGPIQVTTPCGTQYRGAAGLRMRGATMPALAAELQSAANAEVFDRTGLAGAFDIDVDVPVSVPKLGEPRVVQSVGPQIIAALPEQLGLRLDQRREPIEMLVIDRAAPPVED